jgi:hypothetical protein
MKDTYSFRKSSKTMKHVIDVIETYGNKATFKHRGLTWRIVDIKPKGEYEMLMYLEI